MESREKMDEFGIACRSFRENRRIESRNLQRKENLALEPFRSRPQGPRDNRMRKADCANAMLNAGGAASQTTCVPLMAYATVRLP